MKWGQRGPQAAQVSREVAWRVRQDNSRLRMAGQWGSQTGRKPKRRRSVNVVQIKVVHRNQLMIYHLRPRQQSDTRELSRCSLNTRQMTPNAPQENTRKPTNKITHQNIDTFTLYTQTHFFLNSRYFGERITNNQRELTMYHDHR